MPAMPLRRFEQTRFVHGQHDWPLYRAGQGPPVLIMHEVPGITPQVAAFAERVANAGFSVALPSLFGTPGKALSAGYAVGQLLRACISKEFHVLATRGASPITASLRALCRQLHEESGGKGVGAVGMCLTGNFALTLMVDPWVMAPVLSQPSLPFGLTKEKRAAPHISGEDLQTVKGRVAQGACVIGLRFTADPLCSGARFETLRKELGSGFLGVEIDSHPGNAHGIPRRAHSVLTNDLVDREGHPTRAALDEVLRFLDQQLRH
jgi:dienelactone hydrolase